MKTPCKVNISIPYANKLIFLDISTIFCILNCNVWKCSQNKLHFALLLKIVFYLDNSSFYKKSSCFFFIAFIGYLLHSQIVWYWDLCKNRPTWLSKGATPTGGCGGGWNELSLLHFFQLSWALLGHSSDACYIATNSFNMTNNKRHWLLQCQRRWRRKD